MGSIHNKLAASSSLLLRLFTFIFLRWIPGHPLSYILLSLFAVYGLSFTLAVLSVEPVAYAVRNVHSVAKPMTVTKINGQQEVLIDARGNVVEEVVEEETIEVVQKDPKAVKTLITGIPSPSSLLWTLITFGINVLAIGMVLDYSYRAYHFYPVNDLSFARLGYVSDTTANLLVREPNTTQLPLFVSYRHADAPYSVAGHRPFDSAWKHVTSITSLDNTTDYTAAIEIQHLVPDTRYQYALSNAQRGFFITAPTPGTISARSAFGNSFTFLHTSCIIPHFPYSPTAHPLSIPGFSHLAAWLGKIKPAFMLFLGDFIYIDVPVRHGVDAETYRRAYRQVYASPDWPSVAATSADIAADAYSEFNVPWIHVYDDHEIENDWSSNTTGVYPAAFDPYAHYQVSVNPPPYIGPYVPKRPASPYELLSRNETYFAFTHGPASFFMMDARRFRTQPDHATSTMLGATQLARFKQWAREDPPPGVHWKIIVSSVPFTKNWRVNGKDTWGGYLHERREVLETLWDAMATSKRGVRFVILSGDRHEFAATAFPPPRELEKKWPREKCTVHEFSCSPLDMFYLPIRTYKSDGGPDARDGLEDVQIKYLPDGNHKFGAVSITKETGGQSVLRYRLFVEGEQVWSFVLVGNDEIKDLWG